MAMITLSDYPIKKPSPIMRRLTIFYSIKFLVSSEFKTYANLEKAVG